MTRVKCPDKDKWGKLKQVLKYLNGSKYLRFNLSVDDLGLLKWYVDASHNVHWDCRGHGEAMFTLGKGAMSSYSRKVKLGMRGSTETELVMTDMYMPEILWSLHFIEAQGYTAECVGLYQDNISTQLLVKNRRMSSRKKTKHIKVKIFFIKDRVDDGEIKVFYCPTREMWADILTKPLQRMAFRIMRAILMNCPVNYEEAEERTTIKKTIKINANCIPTKKTVSWKPPGAGASHTPQECVGRNQFSTPRPMMDRRLGIRRRSQFSTPRPRTDRRLRVTRIMSRAGTAKRTEQVRSKQ
jgi:hypothetical protein